jgi:peptidoglycan/LPS O-acetylase OafA/YrhL
MASHGAHTQGIRNALLLIGLALGGGAAARGLSTPPLVLLGKASYAMYILHVPMLWWYLRWSKTFSAPIYFLAVIGISALVYQFLEEPANRYLRSRVQAALKS